MICDNPECEVDLTGRVDIQVDPLQHIGPSYVIVHDADDKNYNLCVPCYLNAYSWQVSTHESNPCSKCGGTGRVPADDMHHIMVGKLFIP